MKKEFALPRRTALENAEEIVIEEQAPQAVPAVFLMDRFGYAKTMDPAVFGRNEASARESYTFCVPCKSDSRLCLFTEEGQLYTLKAMDLPAGRMRDKGIPVDNISSCDTSKERVIFADSQDTLRLGRVVFVTGNGMVKAVPGTEFDVIKKKVAATKLAEGDLIVLPAGSTTQSP